MSLIQAESGVKTAPQPRDIKPRQELKPKPFRQVYDEFLFDLSLSQVARQVGMALWKYTQGKPSCFPGNDKLAAHTGYSIRWVQKGLAELKRRGFIAMSLKPHRKNPKIMVRHIEFLIMIGPPSNKLRQGTVTTPPPTESPLEVAEHDRLSPSLAPPEPITAQPLDDAGELTPPVPALGSIDPTCESELISNQDAAYTASTFAENQPDSVVPCEDEA